MYIFGGLASHQKSGNLQTLYECTLKLNTEGSVLYQWEKVKSEGPKARDSHTCVHVSFLIFTYITIIDR